MNETTEKLIRELADKLGTTSEHLWGVMVRQATISGVTQLIVILVGAVAFWRGYKWLMIATTPPPPTPENKYPSSKLGDEGSCWAWGVWLVLLVAFVITVGCSVEKIISSLINPEFWALIRLLGKQ